MFCGCVNVGEVVYVKVCKGVFDVTCEGIPVCAFVVSECLFGGGSVWLMKCVFDKDGEVVRGELMEYFP